MTWPTMPYTSWADTCSALHLWTQIVGKYRLSVTPWVNHSWHATLYVTPAGLDTGPVPDGDLSIQLAFDFQQHALTARSSDGRSAQSPLTAMSVAEFHGQTAQLVEAVGGTFAIHGRPNELADATPFQTDRLSRPYDREAVERYHQAMVRIARVFERFRTGYLGKVSPVHLFWGSFDLAVTRFSGRPAPLHPGGIPNLPDMVTREAYSHEVSSAGFWPGDGSSPEPMFYAYCYPTPDSYSQQPVLPKQARWNADLGEYLLPYSAVQTADDPEGMLMEFLVSTYDAAANSGNWHRAALESGMGIPRVPRPLG